ncbi:MAG: hypothetical protein HYV28_11045 [Ignavibacteriales bacterium]|nr:hypothetical protein [Ignavibacteriales bacterium]
MQKRITSFVFALLLLFASNSFGQQVIGEFPQMDGGFEGQTLGTLVGTSIATGTQRTDWTTSSSNLGGIYTGDTTRTGNKALWAFTTSTAKRWQSPTAAESAIASSTAYTVQFYYRTNGTTATATCMQVGVQGNGTTNTAYTTAASWAGTNNVWTKMQIACTSPAVTASPRYGIGLIRANTPTMGVVLYVDDFVCYAGTADNTAPDAVTSPVTSNQAATVQTVSWTAPVSGVDGGGYLVLRSTSIPNTDPSLNGIYALNDTIGNATIAYIGTSSTFVDNGLTALTTYYYKIYTVDKAFNYSPSASVTGTTVEPSFAIEPTVQASSIVFDNIQSNSFDISWTSGNGSNRVVIAHAGTAVDVTPADGSIYSANAAFGSGSQIGTGNYVVYNGTGSSVSVSGLSKATTYHFTVFEFNGSSGSENYLLTNPPVASKATRPSLKTSNGTGGGDWSVAATWTGGQAPGVGDSVVILSTDIIRLNSTGSCYNLHVQPSGVLQTGVILPTGSLVYLRVYGSSMIIDGTLGGDADALGVEFFTDVTLSGSGTIRPARVRPGASVSNATFTFDANTTVTYNGTTGGGGSAVYVENSSNDNIGIKVNSGKTLTFVDGANFNTNSSSAGLSAVNTLFTIDGTVNMPGTASNMSLTVTSAKTCSLVVNGTLNVGHSLNAANVATAGNVFITVNSPGSMTVATPDFMNSSVYVSGTGTFTLPANGAIRIGHASGLEPVAGPIRTATRNFSSNASYSYIGTVSQSTGSDLPLTVSSFTANNPAGVTLSNSLTVNGFYNDGMGTLTSGGNTLTYGPYAGVRYNDTSAVQTTSDFDFPAVNGPQNLYIDNSRGVNLHASRTIADTLYLVTGKFYLGNNNLTMGANSAALGAVNSAKFLAQNGTGRLKKQFTAPGTFSFPLGDSTTTAAGCPVVLKFNSRTFSSGEVVVTTSNVKHPGNSSTNNYLNRYWTIASTGISGFNADVLTSAK